MSSLKYPTDYADGIASLIDGHTTGLIFKHSYSCDLSAMAFDEVTRYVAEPSALPVLLVDVLDQRPLSARIETELSLLHESPQAILMDGGRVIWHASHRRVTAKAIREAVAAGTVTAL
jgi:bacillithiol system protein YtxJ